MKSNDRPTYELVFRAEPDSVPAVQRLRSLLKYALRAAGMKCVSARELPPEPARPTPTKPAKTRTTLPTTPETTP